MVDIGCTNTYEKKCPRIYPEKDHQTTDYSNKNRSRSQTVYEKAN